MRESQPSGLAPLIKWLGLTLVRRVADRDEVRGRVIDFCESLAGQEESLTG